MPVLFSSENVTLTSDFADLAVSYGVELIPFGPVGYADYWIIVCCGWRGAESYTYCLTLVELSWSNYGHCYSLLLTLPFGK